MLSGDLVNPSSEHDLSQIKALIEPHGLHSFFDRYQAYIQHANKHTEIERLVTDKILEKGSHETRRVLDIGAGTGRLTLAALKAASRAKIPIDIVALEPCKEAADFFEQELTEDLKENATVSLIRGKFEDYQPRKRFDLVLAVHVAYYFESIDSFVQLVRNVVKPGGDVIFVATSTSIMQNEIYRSLFHKLRSNQNLPRTLDSDGAFTFCEEIEIALIKANVRYTRELLRSSITFTLAEICETVNSLKDDKSGPILAAFGFLWRYPDESMLSIKDDWLRLLVDHEKKGVPMVLSYDDVALFASYDSNQ